MNIQTKDYFGGCRREGGGKLKLVFSDLIKLGGTAVTILVLGTVGWVTLNFRVSATEEKIEKVEEAPQQIALIKKDISHILKDQTEIKENLAEFKTEQRTAQTHLHGKLDEILRKL